jgi:hypothetical protein
MPMLTVQKDDVVSHCESPEAPCLLHIDFIIINLCNLIAILPYISRTKAAMVAGFGDVGKGARRLRCGRPAAG